jgi:hypothetical protein
LVIHSDYKSERAIAGKLLASFLSVPHDTSTFIQHTNRAVALCFLKPSANLNQFLSKLFSGAKIVKFWKTYFLIWDKFARWGVVFNILKEKYEL